MYPIALNNINIFVGHLYI